MRAKISVLHTAIWAILQHSLLANGSPASARIERNASLAYAFPTAANSNTRSDIPHPPPRLLNFSAPMVTKAASDCITESLSTFRGAITAPPDAVGDASGIRVDFVQTTYYSCVTIGTYSHCGLHEPIIDSSASHSEIVPYLSLAIAMCLVVIVVLSPQWAL